MISFCKRQFAKGSGGVVTTGGCDGTVDCVGVGALVWGAGVLERGLELRGGGLGADAAASFGNSSPSLRAGCFNSKAWTLGLLLRKSAKLGSNCPSGVAAIWQYTFSKSVFAMGVQSPAALAKLGKVAINTNANSFLIVKA